MSSKDVTFITLNQWFDETLFKESSTNGIYFPSINFDNYLKYRKTYFEKYNRYPSIISILSYDILGLIYYLNTIDKNNFKKNVLGEKKNFVGEIGEFSLEKSKIFHTLDFYQILENKFVQIN